jgi:hypothetical protein
MRNEKLMALSNEELLKNENRSKAAASIFACIWLVLFAGHIYLALKRGFSASTGIPIALLPLLIVAVNQWNELNKEIKFRGL